MRKPDQPTTASGGKDVLVQGHQPATYGDAFADVYDQWYEAVSDVAATTAFLSNFAKDSLVYELGVGTGRLALPLCEAGCTVVGVDASAQMLERCAQHPNLLLVRSDMAQNALVGSFGLIFIAFNTLFNLPTAALQQQVFAEAARLLAPEGRFIVEAITGADLFDGPRSSVGVSSMTTTDVVLSATLLDHAEQTISGQHIHITKKGTRLRPWLLRWSTPEQLDQMADASGLSLERRYSNWNRDPFEYDSPSHVSVYELAGH